MTVTGACEETTDAPEEDPSSFRHVRRLTINQLASWDHCQHLKEKERSTKREKNQWQQTTTITTGAAPREVAEEEEGRAAQTQ
jgi:hypothetical protein